MLRAITENTRLSVGLFVILIGGVCWLNHVSNLAENTANAVESVQKNRDKDSEALAQIKTDVAVIKHILQEEGN